MNVRDEIKKAEDTIQAAVKAAMTELEAVTGLLPTSIDIEMVDAATYGKPNARIAGRVKISVGL
jgi:hypothetical protein